MIFKITKENAQLFRCYMNLCLNIAKVKSRGKIYFHYAETKRIYERQLKYKKNILTPHIRHTIITHFLNGSTCPGPLLQTYYGSLLSRAIE